MRPLMNMDGVYEHHGIDGGDGTVIHYYKGGEVPTITRTSFETFARGNPVFTKTPPIAYLPDLVIQRAESRIGEQQYQLLTNNCEHFANWCKTGQSESQQLLEYGIGLGSINPFEARQIIDRSTQSGNPVETVALLTQAMNQSAIARKQFQDQANCMQSEMATWHRVAQSALAQGREDLARAALERKVKAKQQWQKIQDQIQNLEAMQENLVRNTQSLQRQIKIEPGYAKGNLL